MRVEPGGGAKMWLVNPVRIKNLRAQLDARGGGGGGGGEAGCHLPGWSVRRSLCPLVRTRI